MQGFLPLNEPRYIYAGESIPADQQRFNFGEHRADMHNGLFATKETTFTPWQLANLVPRWVADDAGYVVCIPRQRCSSAVSRHPLVTNYRWRPAIA